MISNRMQPHTLSVITPVPTADEYGTPGAELDYDSATPRTVRGYVQPLPRNERGDGEQRQALAYDYIAYTNDTSITHLDRVTWESNTYEVTGIQEFHSTRGDVFMAVDLHRTEG